jgi:hypothetical protein
MRTTASSGAALAMAMTGIIVVVFQPQAIVAQDAATGGAVTIPADFRTSMFNYVTVDRADGKIYELYINRRGLEGWQRGRDFAPGTVFAIESFAAQRGPDGTLLRDANGKLIKAESENEIHVSEKRLSWADDGACTSESLMKGAPTGTGLWRMAAFDPRNGQRIAQATQKPGECHQCHSDKRAEDFVLSPGVLDMARQASARVTWTWANCGERDICFGGPPKPLSAPLPHCGETFPQ